MTRNQKNKLTDIAARFIVFMLFFLVCGGLFWFVGRPILGNYVAINMPPPAPPIIAAEAPVTIEEITQPQWTGYYLEFPEDTEDWRVTYESYHVGAGHTSYSMIRATWWCFDGSVWASCQPVIRPVEYGDR